MAIQPYIIATQSFLIVNRFESYIIQLHDQKGILISFLFVKSVRGSWESVSMGILFGAIFFHDGTRTVTFHDLLQNCFLCLLRLGALFGWTLDSSIIIMLAVSLSLFRCHYQPPESWVAWIILLCRYLLILYISTLSSCPLRFSGRPHTFGDRMNIPRIIYDFLEYLNLVLCLLFILSSPVIPLESRHTMSLFSLMD